MQALYCYKKALDINPKDVDALWDRSVIFREIGEHVKVRRDVSSPEAVSPVDAQRSSSSYSRRPSRASVSSSTSSRTTSPSCKRWRNRSSRPTGSRSASG